MSTKRYKAILFSPGGDFVLDYRDRNTIEEVEEALANQGSKWYFYPIEAVISDWPRTSNTKARRLVSIAEPFEDFKGCSVRTLIQALTYGGLAARLEMF